MTEHRSKEVVTTSGLVDALREEAPECPRGYCGYCIGCLMQAAATEIEDTMAKSRDLAQLLACIADHCLRHQSRSGQLTRRRAAKHRAACSER